MNLKSEDPRIIALRKWKAAKEQEITDAGGLSQWWINWHEQRFREASREHVAAIHVWEAIQLATHAGLPVPAWTHCYLQRVADCFFSFSRGHKPPKGSRQIASAITAAILEPEAEQKRMELEDAENSLRDQNAGLAMAIQKRNSEIPRRQKAVRDTRAWRDRCRLEARPRRAWGRGANPFAMDDRIHGIQVAMDVSTEIGKRWARDKDTNPVARPSKRILEKAADRHAEYCKECDGKVLGWKRVQQYWLLHESDVTFKHLQRASKHAR